MKIITVADLAKLIAKHGFDKFMQDLMNYIKQDFSRWGEFDKSPRHAVHVEGGVIELMPVADKKYYTFKYVNGHPQNPFSGRQTVVATGQISDVVTGYPLMFSEMTTLTALRTSAATVIMTDLLARKNSKTIALIGTGAQSEFQILGHKLVRDIKEVRYYDTDLQAMLKFNKNMQDKGLDLVACRSAKEAVDTADIIIVCTACKGHVDVILDEWIKPGVHINGLGGDCPGKTEFELPILFRGKIVVEYILQSSIEGEIQRLSPEEIKKNVYAEYWEIISGKKTGRENDDEVTIYDSVGFALEDYSALRLVYDLANKYNLGQDLGLIPPISDPKNLISVLHKKE
ncbi:MAG: ornithine cyclodeaminase/mu-crystallin family protein [Burkholderiales bacterium]|jgi:ornithine cyclodeaminase|nr:ornithine cyclodeaminase/mu-crystallin family protein [Burkholderiales bacterium]